MEITDVRVRKILPEGRLRAIVSITVDQVLAVHDIKIVQGEEKLFVAMPSRQDESGIFRNIIHPFSAATRQYMEEQILGAYYKQLALRQAESDLRQASQPQTQPEPETPAAPAPETAES